MAELFKAHENEPMQFDELKSDLERKIPETKERNRLELAELQEEHQTQLTRRVQASASENGSTGPQKEEAASRAACAL
jgi:hypothetical protein